MKKILIALALAALALESFGMGNRPDTAKLAASAAASSADRAASSAQASASSAAQSTLSAASVVGSEAEAATDAERAEKAAKRAEQAAAKAAAKPQASAHHAGYTWSHFGVDPYAKSRDEAMRKRHDVLVSMGLPPVVIERFMKATEEEGTLTAIPNGQKLDVMMEGSGMRRDVLVDLDAKLVPAAETWETTYQGTTYKLYLPKICNNWSLVKELPRTQVTGQMPPAAPATSSACPAGWTITAHAWSLASLPSDMRREAQSLIEAAKQRDSRQARTLEPYKPDDVSRTMGGRLRKQVRVHAAVSPTVQMRFLDPSTLAVVRELGSLPLSNGMGVMSMPEDPRKYVVETIWPSEFVSPTISGGAVRLRLFGYEWKEWCNMNEHGLVP